MGSLDSVSMTSSLNGAYIIESSGLIESAEEPGKLALLYRGQSGRFKLGDPRRRRWRRRCVVHVDSARRWGQPLEGFVDHCSSGRGLQKGLAAPALARPALTRCQKSARVRAISHPFSDLRRLNLARASSLPGSSPGLGACDAAAGCLMARLAVLPSRDRHTSRKSADFSYGNRTPQMRPPLIHFKLGSCCCLAYCAPVDQWMSACLTIRRM